MPASPTPANVWEGQWVALGAADDFRRKQVTAMRLQGQDIVVYGRRGGPLTAALDVCPHRRAPLSHGTLTAQGCLECPYHNWEFGAGGGCERIPQLPGGGRPRGSGSDLTAIDLQEDASVLWAFLAASGPHDQAPAAARPPLPVVPSAFRAPTSVVMISRTLFADYFEVVANAQDFVHACNHDFGLPQMGGPAKYAVSWKSPGGYAVIGRRLLEGAQGAAQQRPFITTRHDLLGVTSHIIRWPEAPVTVFIWSQVTPVGPGEAFIFNMVTFQASRALSAPLQAAVNLVLSLKQWVPTCLNHMEAMRTIEQDGNMLPRSQPAPSGVEARRNAASGYRLNATDLPFRLFDALYAGARAGRPRWMDAAPTGQARDLAAARVVDRYFQHTCSCPHCRPAYDRARALSIQAPAAAGLCAVAAVASLAQGQTELVQPLLGLATLAGLGGLAAGSLRRRLGPAEPPEYRA